MQKGIQPTLPQSKASYFPENQAPTGMQPGDFLLVIGDNFFSRIVRLGQGLRYGSKNPRIIFTHVVLVEDGETLIEATTKGIKRTPVAKYQKQKYIYVALNISEEDRLEVVNFAKACLKDGYGWLDILSIALTFLTGAKFTFGLDGQEICSGLVARALERTSFIPPRDASHLAPIDLANLFLS